MLNPSMTELMKKVGNRYLLVNLAAQRARDISATAEAENETLYEKPVKLALEEIVDGIIEYREGPKPEPQVVLPDVMDMLGMFDDGEEVEEL